MHTRAYALLLCGALLISGCVPLFYDGSCGPEFRETIVQGTLRSGAGTPMGYAELTLTETRGDTLTRRFRLVLMGTADGNPGPLSGHVTKVRLLADGVVVHEFTFRPGNEHEIIWADPASLAEVPFEALKARAVAGELMLELDSTLEGHARVLTPLTLQLAGRWSRANCS